VKTEYVGSYGRQSSGPDGLSFPIGVTVSNDGKVVVCDTRQNMVKMFDADGRICKVVDRTVTSAFVSHKIDVVHETCHTEIKKNKKMKNKQSKLRHNKKKAVNRFATFLEARKCQGVRLMSRREVWNRCEQQDTSTHDVAQFGALSYDDVDNNNINNTVSKHWPLVFAPLASTNRTGNIYIFCLSYYSDFDLRYNNNKTTIYMVR